MDGLNSLTSSQSIAAQNSNTSTYPQIIKRVLIAAILIFLALGAVFCGLFYAKRIKAFVLTPQFGLLVAICLYTRKHFQFIVVDTALKAAAEKTNQLQVKIDEEFAFYILPYNVKGSSTEKEGNLAFRPFTHEVATISQWRESDGEVTFMIPDEILDRLQACASLLLAG